jgi:predicted P-loop ATPase
MSTSVANGDRQKTQTELEMEAGRKMVERHTAQRTVPVAAKKTDGPATIIPFSLDGTRSVETGLAAFAAPANASTVVPEVAVTPTNVFGDASQIAGVTFRDCYKSGLPKPTLANAVIAIKALGIEARFDLFHHRTNVTYQGDVSTIHEGLLTDHTVSAIRSLINNTHKIDCRDHTLAAIQEIAWANAYDPVLNMLDDCQGKWDGKERLDTWVINYLGCEDTPLNRAIGRKVLIAACRRARHPGCKFDTITVLEGVEGINKSTAIRVLACDDNFSDQSIIGASDKEVQEQLEGVWMHENADLAGMKRADVEHVKAFASRQVDRARPAYGRVREDRPRRSIEWGTTNNKEYLLSQTGNRRFWPLEIGNIDIEALKLDRDKLLGEAATYEAAGETITLDEHLWGDAREAQELRRVADPWEDILDHISDSVTVTEGYQSRIVTIIHRSDDGNERVATADVLMHVLRIPAAQQNSSHGQRLANAMARVGWNRNKSGSVTINGRPARGYIRPDRSVPGGSSPEDQMIGAQVAIAPDGEGTNARQGGSAGV